jgi:hypothetical protein
MKASGRLAWAAVLALGLGLCASEAAAGPKIITQCQTLHEPGAYILGKNLTVLW